MECVDVVAPVAGEGVVWADYEGHAGEVREWEERDGAEG
jgi:hypothetical protein